MADFYTCITWKYKLSGEHRIIRYWGRKPATLARKFISNYSNDGDVVLDSFGGSGVFVKTALELRRRALYIDLNPFAKLVATSTIQGCSISGYGEAVAKILGRENLRIRKRERTLVVKRADLFSIYCKCGRKAEAQLVGFTRYYTVAKRIQGVTGNVTAEVAAVFQKHQTLSHPNLLALLPNVKSAAISFSINLLVKKGLLKQNECLTTVIFVERCKCGRVSINLRHSTNIWVVKGPISTNIWFPKNELRYLEGKSFLKKRDVESVDQLFLDRSLVLLAQIWKDIEVVKADPEVKRCLRLTFLASLARCSKMNRLNGGSWPINCYWIPRDFVARNPYRAFSRASKYVLKFLENRRPVKVGSVPFVIRRKANISILNADSTRICLPRNSIDYAIIDPPHTDEAQFFELSLFYTAWMRSKLNFAREVVINSQQDKSLERYIKMLQEASRRIYSALKHGACYTTILHEEDPRILVQCSRAIQQIGFERVKVSSFGDYSVHTFRKP